MFSLSFSLHLVVSLRQSSLGKVFVTLMDLVCVLDNTGGIARRISRKKRSLTWGRQPGGKDGARGIGVDRKSSCCLAACSRFTVLLPLHRLHYESRGKNQRRSRKENGICLVGLIAARLSRL